MWLRGPLRPWAESLLQHAALEGDGFDARVVRAQGDLATLTERVRRRVIGWFSRQRLLDAHAAADMLAWENSGFSIDASVRITLLDRDVPRYSQSLEHLLRSRNRFLGRGQARGAGATGSRAAQQSGDADGSAIGRTILNRSRSSP